MTGVRIPEAYRAWAKAARRQGWTIEVANSGHLRWTPPAGRCVFTPMTGQAHGSTMLVRSKLKKAGLKL